MRDLDGIELWRGMLIPTRRRRRRLRVRWDLIGRGLLLIGTVGALLGCLFVIPD